MSRKNDLPFGSKFSPSQIDLTDAEGMAETHGGDWHAFEDAVRVRWFDGHATSDYNRGKLANNTKLGMIAYGIIDRDASLTEFGRELLALRSNAKELYGRLAKHILLHPKPSRPDVRACRISREAGTASRDQREEVRQ